MLRALLVLAAISAGCGPYLKHDEVRREAWSVSERCAQGPFEVHAKTLGARWGESLQVSVAAPRRVAGRFELWLADKRIADGPWRANLRMEPLPGSQAPPPPPPFQLDNERCLPRPLQDPTIVLQPPPPYPVAVIDAPPAPEPEPAPQPEPPRAPPHLIASDAAHAVEGSRAWSRITSWSVEQHDPAATSPVAARLPLRVVIWSDVPNDLDGARFVLVQAALRPNVTDGEWVAHLQAERAEAERRTQAWRQEQETRAAHCRAHLDDEDCWGDGGYAGHKQRQRALEARWRTQAAAAKSPPTPAPQIAAPQGPPPPPKPELPGPKPVADAEWVSGSWAWLAGAWAWRAGWWLVPERPQVAGRTRDRYANAPEGAAAPDLVLRRDVESPLGRGARARSANCVGEGPAHGCAQTTTQTHTLTITLSPR